MFRLERKITNLGIYRVHFATLTSHEHIIEIFTP